MIEGDRVYVRDSNQLIILDISDPTDPKQLGTGFVYSYEPAVVEDMFVYHAYDTTSWGFSLTGELRVIDTHNPISATVVYTTEIAGAPGEMDTLGGVLAIELVHSEYPWTQSLQLIDVTDPAAPELAGQIQNLSYNVTDIEIVGDLLYFCDVSGSVVILDISDLDNPVLIGLYEQETPTYSYPSRLDVAAIACMHFSTTRSRCSTSPIGPNHS
jgi:hypothetical protein